jgi:multiple sugar transport system substrate-binding protein
MKYFRLFTTKKITNIIPIILFISLLITACNPQSGAMEDSPRTTITIAAAGFFQKQYETLIEEFESQTPSIHVQFVPLEEATPGETLEHTLAASLADVVMISPPQGQDIYYYLDIEPILETDQLFDASAFWPGSLDGCRAEGRLIGIPLSIQTLLVMFNGAVFDEIGLEHPTPGWSWEDFQEAAQALTKRSGGEVTRYGFVDYNHPTALLAPLIDAVNRQNGNEYDPVKLTNALDWYVSLAQNGHIPSDYSAEEAGEVRNYISTGQAAMWVDALSSLEERRNELGESIAVAPFPQGGINGNQQTTQAWASCGLVSAGTAHSLEALTWLQFLSTQGVPGINSLAIPANRAAAEESGYWNSLDVNTAAAARYALEHGWYGAASNLPFEQIGQALNDAKTGEINLADALALIRMDQIAAIPPTQQSTPFAVATPKPPVISVPLSDDTIVVDYYGDSSDLADKETIEALAQAFMLEHPDIIIRIEDFRSSGLPYINFDLMAENYGCFIYQSGLADYYVSQLYNLQPLIDAGDEGRDLLNDLPESEILRNQLNGDLYALPVADRPTVLYYNKDIFIEKGVPFPALDWTWADFWQAAIAVASEDVYGFVPINGREFINILLAAEGIELYDFTTDSPVINFNDPKFHAIVSNLVEMGNNGVIPTIDEHIDWNKGNTQFRFNAVQSGNAAMWLNMAGIEYGGYFPPETPIFEVGVVPVPSFGYPLMPMNNGTAFYISRQAENPTACWEWINFLSDKPEAIAGIPLRQSILESERYEQIVGVELATVYRAVMEHPRQEILPDYSEKYPSYPLYLWWPDTLASVFEGVPVTQALTELQGKSESYLNCVESNSDPLNEAVWKGCAKLVDPDFQSLLYSE